MPDAARRFARRVFTGAAVYGIVALLPQYFLEDRIGRDFPPAITHPEFYYGFVGVALAWQVTFLVIGLDPVRYRPMMLVAALVEKFVFGIAGPVLYFQGRVPVLIAVFAGIDVALGLLFLESWRRTRPADVAH